jgi:putative colanic acid biosynthesis glycosyltransferase
LAFFYKLTLAHPASFIKRALFADELYDENYRIVSDWKFFIKKIIIENVAIQHIDLPISYFDTKGMSSIESMQKLVKSERQDVLNSLFPPLVLNNIKELLEIRNFRPVKNILEINKYRGFRYFVFKFNKISLRLYKRLFSLLNKNASDK